ncbi:MAG: MarR family transcriptional regulator [Lachnospiraceae bacterium]|nr:MarR family transcriptional regulator [Lachnospiraceae bacterium]
MVIFVDLYESMNEFLVGIFKDIMDIEEKAIITSEFKDITNNDMHIIEAIGISEPKNMSTVAKSLSVTIGTLTIAMNNLVKKGYVERVRSQEDRRVVLLSLSKKGRKAYEHHKVFHNNMIQATVDKLTEEEKNILAKALVNLKGYFEEHKTS